MRVQVMTAGPYPKTGYVMPEQTLIDCVEQWNRKKRIQNHPDFGVLQDQFSVTPEAKCDVRMITHETVSVVYNEMTKTIEAELRLLGTPLGSRLRLMSVTDQEKYLWRIPIGMFRTDEATKTFSQVEIARIDLYLGATPFEYPWKHLSNKSGRFAFDAYERAMSILE